MNNGRGYLYELDIAEPIPCQIKQNDIPLDSWKGSGANTSSSPQTVRIFHKRREGSGDCFLGGSENEFTNTRTQSRHKRNLIADRRKFWNTVRIPYQISANFGTFELFTIVKSECWQQTNKSKWMAVRCSDRYGMGCYFIVLVERSGTF